jgi:manganese transport protein
MLRRLLAIVYWSVLAAAFIGPGTVTTAASAGARFGYALLWALVFSVIACLTLQEAAARLTVGSGLDLGRALRAQFASARVPWLPAALAGGAVVVGCAAFQAGNLLGAAAGLGLLTAAPPPLATLVFGTGAALLLWLGTPRILAHLLSLAVGLMGVAFLVTAWHLAPALRELLAGAFLPSAPAGSGLVILGLVGTTVVPYNLFLGSGLAVGEELGSVRLGIAVAVVLGGVISMGVVVVGAAVVGDFSFPALAAVLARELGPWASSLVALGLVAAGFSSAVTAPLAAAMAVRSVASAPGREPWTPKSAPYRLVWGGVLVFGVAFGVAGVQPIPAILAAQAANGLLLPLVALFLLGAVNDRRLMGGALNRGFSNAVMSVVVAVAFLLGLLQLARAGAGIFGFPLPAEGHLLGATALLTAALAWPVGRWVARHRAP